MKIHINNFITRQTATSPFSHFTGPFSELAQLVESNFENATPGFREGVVLVSVPVNGMFTSVCTLSEGDELKATFEPRRKGEEPRKTLRSLSGEKIPAVSVQVVVFSSTVLAENNDNELPPVEGNWEMISLNCSPVEGETPIAPATLLYNHFGGSGGTDTQMSDAELVTALRVSHEFWKDKAMAVEA